MNEGVEILYEDEHMLAINKPAGLAVHSDGKSAERTLVDWAVEKYPEMARVGEPLKLATGEEVERHGVVHRLDRDTSGVLVLAKTQAAFEHLKEQFQKREVEKVYKAVVYGVVKNDTGVIDRPIGRSAGDFRKWSAQRGARGQKRQAVTEYEVFKRGKEHTLLEVRPKTGRTHQIRVHLKAINHPVVCDKLYAPKQECALGMERQALHAEKVSLTGLGGKRITVEAPLPEDIEQAIAQIR